MATLTSKEEFKEYCLRKLGKPVIEINVDDDQVSDRIDEALKYYWDYHLMVLKKFTININLQKKIKQTNILLYHKI